MRRLAVVAAAAGSKQLSKLNTYSMTCAVNIRRNASATDRVANEIEMHFVCAETRAADCRPVCRLRINIVYCLEKCVLVKTS